MDIRWMAVFSGFLADYLISMIILVVANPGDDFQNAPNLSQPSHLLLLSLMMLSTGVGGFVAGRIAKMNVVWHGALVGIMGILLNQLVVMGGDSIPKLYVIASAIGCVVGALGGWLSLIGQKAE